MTGSLKILRAGPLATIQDAGRFGMLRYGIGASGPMVKGAFDAVRGLLEQAGTAAIEFTRTGLDFTVDTPLEAAFCGGEFKLTINRVASPWNNAHRLEPGDTVRIAPGGWGNYGYVCLDREIDVPVLLGSRATNSTVGFGGFDGRALVAGDKVSLGEVAGDAAPAPIPSAPVDAPIAVLWGLHADFFPSAMCQKFIDTDFEVSTRLDRMGVRLDRGGVFPEANILSLVSDAVVAGDIQILGDGTPIVLMRDHQPTGGYPRIATIVSADLDRFAQLRPGAPVRFAPVTLSRALAMEIGRR